MHVRKDKESKNNTETDRCMGQSERYLCMSVHNTCGVDKIPEAESPMATTQTTTVGQHRTGS